MTDPIIEKGVPLPATHSKKSANTFWRKMEVGDSVWLPQSQKNVAGVSAYWRRTLGHKYTTRVENNGTRIWRVE